MNAASSPPHRRRRPPPPPPPPPPPRLRGCACFVCGSNGPLSPPPPLPSPPPPSDGRHSGSIVRASSSSSSPQLSPPVQSMAVVEAENSSPHTTVPPTPAPPPLTRFSIKAVQKTLTTFASIALAAATLGGVLIHGRRVWCVVGHLLHCTGVVIERTFAKYWGYCSREVLLKGLRFKNIVNSSGFIRYQIVHLRRRRKKEPSFLTKEQWESAFHPQTGRINDVNKVLKKIRSGGIDPAIRSEVWLFLLGLYDFNSTEEERESERIRKREEYEHLRKQCIAMRRANRVYKSKGEVAGADLIDLGTELTLTRQLGISGQRISGASLANEGDSLRKSASSASREEQTAMDSHEMEGFGTWQRIMRLDASRMGTEWVPFSPSQSRVSTKQGMDASLAGLSTPVPGPASSSDGSDHLDPCRRHHAARLVAILEAYAVYDPGTGYCQGMGELLSPLAALLEEDHEAFWCFAGFMRAARDNFRLDELGVRRQLAALSRILRAADPQLYRYLEGIHAHDCVFAYRMLVVLLRRELSFAQTLSLWEVMWADKVAVSTATTITTTTDTTTNATPSSTTGMGKRRKSWWSKAPPTNDLLLYVIAAAICQRRKVILNKCTAMDDVVRECNSMAGHLDLWSLIEDARQLVFALHNKIPSSTDF